MVGKRLLLAQTLSALGVDRAVARLASPALLIINYHRLSETRQSGPSRFDDGVFGPDVETFRRQVQWLKSVTTVLDEEGLIHLASGGRAARGTLYSAVTFDDGYIDCYTLARPVLDELGIQGIFFIPVEMLESRRLGWWDIAAYLLKRSRHGRITMNGEQFDLRRDFPGSLRRILMLFKLEKAERTDGYLEMLSHACDVMLPSKDDQSAELMSWSNVREMKSTGHAIGSHSLSHRVLATLDPATQALEIRQSKRELEAIIGRGVSSFAYPVGGPAHFNEHSVALAREAGYEQAFTFNTGIASLPVPDPFRIPREAAKSLAELRAKARLPWVMGLASG